MGRFFNVDNPIWRFIGNLADVFVVSLLWIVCSLPVITIGASTTAMYYVTLKLASGQEGYTVRSFFKSFRENFRQGTMIWIGSAAVGAVLYLDVMWCPTSGTSLGRAMIITAVILCVIYVLFMFMIFPLLARCENTVSALVRMAFALCIRNAVLLFSAVVITAAVFYAALFYVWILIIIAPGLSAFLNSFIINRIFEKYHLNLQN